MRIFKTNILQSSIWIFILFFLASYTFSVLAEIDSPIIISLLVSLPLTVVMSLTLDIIRNIRTPETSDQLETEKPLLTKYVGFYAGKGNESFYVRGPLAKLHLYKNYLVIDASPMWFFKIPYNEIEQFEKTFKGIKSHHKNKKHNLNLWFG